MIQTLCIQWAFGVTAWEIFTCGRIPYAGINALRLLKALQSGERLGKPDNEVCQDEMLVNCSNPPIIVIVVQLHLSEWVCYYVMSVCLGMYHQMQCTM